MDHLSRHDLEEIAVKPANQKYTENELSILKYTSFQLSKNSLGFDGISLKFPKELTRLTQNFLEFHQNFQGCFIVNCCKCVS